MTERTYTLLTGEHEPDKEKSASKDVNFFLVVVLSIAACLALYVAIPPAIDSMIQHSLPLQPPVERVVQQNEGTHRIGELVIPNSITIQDKVSSLIQSVMIPFVVAGGILILSLVIWFVRGESRVSMLFVRWWIAVLLVLVILGTSMRSYQRYEQQLFYTVGEKYHSVQVQYAAMKAQKAEYWERNVNTIALSAAITKSKHTLPFKNCSFTLMDNTLYYYTAQGGVGYTCDFSGITVEEMQWLPMRFGTDDSPYISLLFSFGKKKNRHLLMIFNHDKGLIYERMFADDNNNVILQSAEYEGTKQVQCIIAGDSVHTITPTDTEKSGKMQPLYDKRVYDTLIPFKNKN